jgi:hypothetical protein
VLEFDIQGDTDSMLEFELTGTLEGSTFRGTGIRDRGRHGSNNGNRGTDAESQQNGTGQSGIGIGVAQLDIAATVPFDIQGDTHVLEFKLMGMLDGGAMQGLIVELFIMGRESTGLKNLLLWDCCFY